MDWICRLGIKILVENSQQENEEMAFCFNIGELYSIYCEFCHGVMWVVVIG